MPSFDIVKHSPLRDSYRVQAVIGAFDLNPEKLDEHFTGSIDIEGKDWNIGLIVGGSGTGKTTIAREIFGDCIYAGMPHTEGGGSFGRYAKGLHYPGNRKDVYQCRFCQPAKLAAALLSPIQWRKDALRPGLCAAGW